MVGNKYYIKANINCIFYNFIGPFEIPDKKAISWYFLMKTEHPAQRRQTIFQEAGVWARDYTTKGLRVSKSRRSNWSRRLTSVATATLFTNLSSR